MRARVPALMCDQAPWGLALALAAGVCGLAMATDVMAHGGGLNAEGCHTDRRTGDYHCHRGGGASGAGSSRSRAQTLSSPSSTYYSSCAAARAAGAAPLRAGEPGYRRGLDRDGDGVACE